MSVFCYIDYSNLWIEGSRVKSLKAQCLNERTGLGDPFDSFCLNFGELRKLIEAVVPGQNNGNIKIFASSRSGVLSDALIQAARLNFEIVFLKRNQLNLEKGIDTAIAFEMASDSIRKLNVKTDVILLISGDGDFQYPVEQLIGRGHTVNVMFWNRAAQKLKDCCSRFILLDPYLEQICNEVTLLE